MKHNLLRKITTTIPALLLCTYLSTGCRDKFTQENILEDDKCNIYTIGHAAYEGIFGMSLAHKLHGTLSGLIKFNLDKGSYVEIEDRQEPVVPDWGYSPPGIIKVKICINPQQDNGETIIFRYISWRCLDGEELRERTCDDILEESTNGTVISKDGTNFFFLSDICTAEREHLHGIYSKALSDVSKKADGIAGIVRKIEEKRENDEDSAIDYAENAGIEIKPL